MINLTRLHSITGGDKETENMLLGLFVETAQRVLSDLEAGGDWKKLVHELKGAAANLGVEALHKACAAMEFSEPQDSNRQQFFDEIKQAISGVKRLIA